MLRSEGHASPKARSSGHLSMEIRPPPSEGKGGEVPLLHRPLSLHFPSAEYTQLSAT